MTLTFGQASYNGVKLGPGGSAQFQPTITGLSGLPTIRNGDVPRPNAAGMLAGYDYAGDRQITFTIDHVTANGLNPIDNLSLVRSAFQPVSSLGGGLGAPTTSRFVYNFGEGAVSGFGVNRFVIVRPRKFLPQIDLGYAAGGGTTGLISADVLLDAVDPYIYDNNVQSQTVGLTVAAGGWTFPWTFPWAFTTSTGGLVFATNAGDASCYPLITITGPCINPRVEQQTTGVTIGFTTTLNVGDSLVLDTYNGTAVLNGAVSRTNALSAGSYINALAIPPGTSTLGFYSADSSATAAQMTVTYTNVWQ